MSSNRYPRAPQENQPSVRSAVPLSRKVMNIFATEGARGIAARIRRRWRLRTFRPYVLNKRYEEIRFRFLIGRAEGQEWYGKNYDQRLYKPRDAELAWLRSVVARGDFVADVGAHHGYFAVIFAHWVGDDGRVFAFECLPENAAIASYNAIVNQLENIEVVAKAVGARLGTTVIANNSEGVLVDETTPGERITVPMISLDEFFASRRPDLLKIDVEGYELEVLRGAGKCLARRPAIALEFHCFKYENATAEVRAILDLLPQDDYKFKLAAEAGDDLVDYSLNDDSAAFIGAHYNPHLYAIPTRRG